MIRELYGKFRQFMHWSKIDCNDRKHIWSHGVYIQDTPHIHIGKGCWIGPNVGIIAINHDINNPDEHVEPKDVWIGDHCWIGMSAIVLPGVVLGPHTVVGAGAVVTKSFVDGNCVIGGNPARRLHG